jgi:hypothetical protein
MAKLQAMWIHGSGVAPAREGYFISKVKLCNGTYFTSQNDPGNGGEWFHFAIPTPVILDGQRAVLKKIYVFYKTDLSAKITIIHVYDASKKIAGFEPLSLEKDHSTVVDKYNSWAIPNSPAVGFGIGISVFVDFGKATPDRVPGILFTTAGADFETPEG